MNYQRLTPLAITSGPLLTDGVLQVAAGLAGDYNAEGVVDAADYTVWRDAARASGTGLAADGNGDLHVDQQDYVLWKTNFGASLNLGSRSSAAVLEPESLLLLTLALGFGRLLHRAAPLRSIAAVRAQ